MLCGRPLFTDFLLFEVESEDILDFEYQRAQSESESESSFFLSLEMLSSVLVLTIVLSPVEYMGPRAFKRTAFRLPFCSLIPYI
jgi:hypothetical protein